MALLYTYVATWRPSARPLTSPVSKWIPPSRREVPASSPVCDQVGSENVTALAGVFGQILRDPAGTVTVAPNVSPPVNQDRIAIPAPLNVECPETYSGNPGVTTFVAW